MHNRDELSLIRCFVPCGLANPRKAIEKAAPKTARARVAALILTVAVHGGILALVWGSGGRDNAVVAQPAQVTVLNVNLKMAAHGNDGASGSVAHAAGLKRQMVAAGGGTTGLSKPEKIEEALVSIVQPIGPHYFRMSELTQRPEVVQDAVTDLVVRMPGLSPQPVVLRLLISDEGLVDHVIVEDSFLAAEVEQTIKDAFAKIRFEPGKIGRTAVRSQMRVEARIETMEQRLPVVIGESG